QRPARAPLHVDRAHTPHLGVHDALPREIVVHSAHPAVHFALALAHRADLLRLLERSAKGFELAASRALLPCIAYEGGALVDTVHRLGHLAPWSTPGRLYASVGADSGEVDATLAICLPCLRSMRSTPVLRSVKVGLQRSAICPTCRCGRLG